MEEEEEEEEEGGGKANSLQKSGGKHSFVRLQLMQFCRTGYHTILHCLSHEKIGHFLVTKCQNYSSIQYCYNLFAYPNVKLLQVTLTSKNCFYYKVIPQKCGQRHQHPHCHKNKSCNCTFSEDWPQNRKLQTICGLCSIPWD